MKTPKINILWLIILIVGASLQNILWYLRLKNPLLMREFILYFERDGAKVFLEFNILNYSFLIILLIVYLIILFYSKRKNRLDEGEGQ